MFKNFIYLTQATSFYIRTVLLRSPEFVEHHYSSQMIYEVLNSLKIKLNSSLSEVRRSTEPFVILSNPWTNNDSNKGATFLNAISLINIEEEKNFKMQGLQITQTPEQRKKNVYSSREPDIKLNLFILISAYNKNYDDGLKFISMVVNYFQENNVFVRMNNGAEDDLPENVEKIVVELYTATFEQQNQIWASLSTGYIPSVIYKLRMLTIDSVKSREVKSITERIIKIQNGIATQ